MPGSVEILPEQNETNRYSLSIGLIFIFNIIVGTGALTLPAAFAHSGWLLGTVSIIFLAFISYINATYVIECMACANALKFDWEALLNDVATDSGENDSNNEDANVKTNDESSDDNSNEDNEANLINTSENIPVNTNSSNENKIINTTENIAINTNDENSDECPLINRNYHFYRSISINSSASSMFVGNELASLVYNLDNRVELGEMTSSFFSPLGRLTFYIVMIVYLYGDLSIYLASIGKSTMKAICTSGDENYTHLSFPNDELCFNSTNHYTAQFTKLQCYRIVLFAFICLLGPFVFSDVQKTKYLQIFTSITRWLAFSIMITLAVCSIVKHGAKGNPPMVNLSAVPALFGSCIYSFMCHHSLPGMVAPIVSKKRLYPTLMVDFGLISVFYLLLALTGVFAFSHLQDLYTLNFAPSVNSSDGVFLKLIEYFLTLFPVFTLTTTFPVLAITLRNNIQFLFLDKSRIETYNLFLRRLLFPFVAIIPPLLLTMFVEDITFLVSMTGSYAGTGVQYLIPTFLVMAARKECSKSTMLISIKNLYQSPFKHKAWSLFIIAWSVFCIIMVSMHLFNGKITVI